MRSPSIKDTCSKVICTVYPGSRPQLLFGLLEDSTLLARPTSLSLSLSLNQASSTPLLSVCQPTIHNMAAAVLTRSAMQFPLLVVGIAICLSCLATPVVRSQYYTCPTYHISYEEQQQIVDRHNLLRSKVYPYASNMRRMVCGI